MALRFTGFGPQRENKMKKSGPVMTIEKFENVRIYCICCLHLNMKTEQEKETTVK